MAQRSSSRSYPMLAAAVCFGLSASALLPAVARAEPSLANLLSGRAAQHDPTEPLEQLLNALERRPFAADRAVRDALAQARRELAQLREAYAGGAPGAVVQRRTNLVWAALSAADRLQARVATAAALGGLEQLARDAEAAAERARQQLERAQRGSASGVQPVESAP